MCIIIQRGTWLLHVLLGPTSYGLDADRRSFVCVRLCVLFLCFNVDSNGMSTLCIFVLFCFSYIYSHYTRICILHKDSIRSTLWIRFQNDMIWFKHLSFVGIFSSPEPKAQVSCSDHRLSVVRRCCCLRRRRLCRRKLFAFFLLLQN